MADKIDAARQVTGGTSTTPAYALPIASSSVRGGVKSNGAGLVGNIVVNVDESMTAQVQEYLRFATRADLYAYPAAKRNVGQPAVVTSDTSDVPKPYNGEYVVATDNFTWIATADGSGFSLLTAATPIVAITRYYEYTLGTARIWRAKVAQDTAIAPLVLPVETDATLPGGTHWVEVSRSSAAGPILSKALSADITTGTDDTKYATPLSLRQANVVPDAERFMGNWNPNTNVPALVNGTGIKGQVYRVVQGSSIVSTVTTGATSTATFAVASVGGLANGQTAIVTDPNDPSFTSFITITGIVGLNVTVNQAWPLLAGQTLYFSQLHFGINNFLTGDNVAYNGAVWQVRAGKGLSSDFHNGLMSAADHRLFTSMDLRNNALGLFTLDGVKFTVINNINELFNAWNQNQGGDFFQTTPRLVLSGGNPLVTNFPPAGRWFARGNSIDTNNNDFRFETIRMYDAIFIPNRTGRVSFGGALTEIEAKADETRNTVTATKLFRCILPLYIGFTKEVVTDTFIILDSCIWHESGTDIVSKATSRLLLRGSTANVPRSGVTIFAGRIIDERHVASFPEILTATGAGALNWFPRGRAHSTAFLQLVASVSSVNFSSATEGSSGTLLVRQDATGGRIFAIGGITMPTAPNAKTIFSFTTINGETFWLSKNF